MILDSIMPIILTTIILIVCGVALVQAVNHLVGKSYYSSQNVVIIDVVVLIMYIVGIGFIGMLYLYSGFDMTVVYVSLGFMVAAMIVLFIIFCVRHKDTMEMGFVIAFVIYFLLIAYATIFSRFGSVDTSIVTTPFDDLMNAIENRDPLMVEHMTLNVALFVPFGYLIPSMNSENLRKWSFAMLGGIAVSTVIEGCQMIFALGQSDIDDIIANSIGAVIGYVFAWFIWRVKKNWTI